MIHKSLLTVVFQVKDEQEQITNAVKSAKLLTNNIIVMDMKSTDQTARLANNAGAKVISIPSEEYVELIRNFAFTKTDSDWILILDADERMTPELAQEINTTLVSNLPETHYYLPRLNIFNGQPFKHGGWWPDKQIRLIKRQAFIEWPKQIHSTVKVSGETGSLNNYFLHNFHGNLHGMVSKTIKFENTEADLLFKAGRKVNVAIFFRKYLAELYRRLLKFQGWRDGPYGIIESIYQAYSKTITWLLLYEKKLLAKQ